MAEYKVLDMVQDILTCSICLDEANDPRLLLCQHTFCYKCIKQYVEKKQGKDDIDCPVCRKMCPLPKGNVDDLQENFLYKQLMEVNKIIPGQKENTDKEKVKADKICHSGGCGQSAECFCETCKYICAECEADHKNVRSLKTHVILTLNEAETIQRNALQPCPKHPNKVLELYCEHCDLPMCVMCHALDHQGHKCEQLTTKAASAKQQLEKMMITINGYLDKSDKMSESVEHHLARLGESADNMKQKTSSKVTSTKSDMNRELEDREHVILQDVDTSYSQAEKMSQGNSDRVNHLKMSLTSLKSYSNQLYLYGSPCDYVSKIKLVEERLRENNPADVKLTLQEMDTTGAEQKLHDLTSYEELHDTLKETRLTLDKQTVEFSAARILHQKKVGDLERQLEQQKEANDNKVGDLERQLEQQKKANELTELIQLIPQPVGGTWTQGTGRVSGHDTITITCTFPAGIQNASHPRPGQPYPASTLTCWIWKADQGPGNPAGSVVAALMKRAFDARCLFTVKGDQVAWHGAVFWSEERIHRPNTIKRLSELGIKL